VCIAVGGETFLMLDRYVQKDLLEAERRNAAMMAEEEARELSRTYASELAYAHGRVRLAGGRWEQGDGWELPYSFVGEPEVTEACPDCELVEEEFVPFLNMRELVTA